MNRLLFICGKMGAGKDTLADWVVERGPELFGPGVAVGKMGLTDQVKKELAVHFDFDVDVLHGTSEQKARQLPNAVNGMTYREALRLVCGCYDYMEPGHLSRCLVRRVEDEAKRWRMPMVVAVNDLRRLRDAEMFREQGAKFVRLTRRSPLSDNHFTEVELDDWPGFDAVIHNDNCTVMDTRREMHEILKKWGWSK